MVVCTFCLKTAFGTCLILFSAKPNTVQSFAKFVPFCAKMLFKDLLRQYSLRRSSEMVRTCSFWIDKCRIASQVERAQMWKKAQIVVGLPADIKSYVSKYEILRPVDSISLKFPSLHRAHLNPNVHESGVLKSKQTKLDFGLWINLEKSLKWNSSYVNDIMHRMFRTIRNSVSFFATSRISAQKYEQIRKISGSVDSLVLLLQLMLFKKKTIEPNHCYD